MAGSRCSSRRSGTRERPRADHLPAPRRPRHGRRALRAAPPPRSAVARRPRRRARRRRRVPRRPRAHRHGGDHLSRSGGRSARAAALADGRASRRRSAPACCSATRAWREASASRWPRSCSAYLLIAASAGAGAGVPRALTSVVALAYATTFQSSTASTRSRSPAAVSSTPGPPHSPTAERLGNMPAELRRLCPDARWSYDEQLPLGPAVADRRPAAPRTPAGEFARRDHPRPAARLRAASSPRGHCTTSSQATGSAPTTTRSRRGSSRPTPALVLSGLRGPIPRRRPDRAAATPSAEPNRYVGRFAGTPRFDVAAARGLHDYQRVVYTWGPLLAVCLLLVVAALVARRGTFRLRPTPPCSPCSRSSR